MNRTDLVKLIREERKCTLAEAVNIMHEENLYEENLRLGFKVLFERNKQLFSAVQEPETGGIRYIIGKWAKPKKGNGPLFVFNDIESAFDFSNSLYSAIYGDVSNSLIYKCLYVESKGESKVWFTNKNRTRYSFVSSMPRGSILAERVRLIKGGKVK